MNYHIHYNQICYNQSMDGLFLKKLLDVITPKIYLQYINHFEMMENKTLVMSLKNGSFVISLNKGYFMFYDTLINLPDTSNHFLTMLRSKVRNGQITNIQQLNFDRVIQIIITKKNDIYLNENYFIYIELTGNRYNIILTNDNNIVLASVNPRSSPYILPKIVPYNSIKDLYNNDNRYSLIAPYIYDYMQLNNLNINQMIELIDKSNTLFFNIDKPHFFEFKKDKSLPIEEGLKVLYNVNSFTNINLDFRKETKNLLEYLKNKTIKRISFIENALNDQSHILFKDNGEYLLTYGNYGKEYIIETRPDIIIPDNLSINEYAEKLFNLYKKGKNRLLFYKNEIIKLNEDLTFISFLEDELTYSTKQTIIDIKNKLITRQLIKGKPIKPLGKPLLLRIEYKGFNIYIGRNHEQNEKITFSLAKPDDIFLHVTNSPGAHVVINPFTDDIDVLKYAGKQAKKYSSLENETSAIISYTKIKYVKHTPEHNGKVVLLQFKTLQVKD